MAPSRNILVSALFSAALVTASPISGKIDTAMPFLSSATETTVWWTPEATQDWNTWSASLTAATPAAVITSSASSVPYSNPFTIYTTMTNSDGVITGMPAVVTSQPSPAAKATECSGCASVLSAEASWSSMVASMYSSTTPAAAVASGTSATSELSESASATSAGPTFAQNSGATSRQHNFDSGVSLLIFGIVAYLL